MSMTKEKAIEEFEKDSEYYAESGSRLKNGALDDHYISAYEEKPTAKKIDLLREAIAAAGLNMKATRQRAYEIHNRLADVLEKRLLARAKDARALGLSTLLELCKSAQSESVKAQVATTLTKDIFPNVSIKKTESIDDIEEQLQRNQEEIEQLTGVKH